MKKIKQKFLRILAVVLAESSSEEGLDRLYRSARDRQHREEDHWYRNKAGAWQQCRIAATEWDDPMMRMSGCSEEFSNDFRKKDLHDGCPWCTGDVMENASEPDVMRRWELHS